MRAFATETNINSVWCIGVPLRLVAGIEACQMRTELLSSVKAVPWALWGPWVGKI